MFTNSTGFCEKQIILAQIPFTTVFKTFIGYNQSFTSYFLSVIWIGDNLLKCFAIRLFQERTINISIKEHTNFTRSIKVFRTDVIRTKQIVQDKPF